MIEQDYCKYHENKYTAVQHNSIASCFDCACLKSDQRCQNDHRGEEETEVIVGIG